MFVNEYREEREREEIQWSETELDELNEYYHYPSSHDLVPRTIKSVVINDFVLLSPHSSSTKMDNCLINSYNPMHG